MYAVPASLAPSSSVVFVNAVAVSSKSVPPSYFFWNSASGYVYALVIEISSYLHKYTISTKFASTATSLYVTSAVPTPLSLQYAVLVNSSESRKSTSV